MFSVCGPDGLVASRAQFCCCSEKAARVNREGTGTAVFQRHWIFPNGVGLGEGHRTQLEGPWSKWLTCINLLGLQSTPIIPFTLQRDCGTERSYGWGGTAHTLERKRTPTQRDPHSIEAPQVWRGQDLPWAEPSADSINKVYRFSGFFIRCLPHRTVREQSVGERNEANSTMLVSAQCFGGSAKSPHTVPFMWYLRGTCGLRAIGGTCAWVCVNIWAVHRRTIILAATWNNGLVQNWERSTPRLYLVTLLI